jgi:AraC family transcriptional regulator of arabinose operon
MDPRVDWAIEQMHARLAEPLRVVDLAARVNLSASRFAHLFTQHAGVPPLRYLNTIRLERARLLLERTFLSVKEVMAQVGFSDPGHFSRDFRRYHGIDPSELRRDYSAARPTAPEGRQ